MNISVLDILISSLILIPLLVEVLIFIGVALIIIRLRTIT
jgi:hypothetical protein